MATAQTTSKLRRWREEAGWTLDEVAGLTGLSTAMLSRAERGERTLSPAAKVTMARRLGVSVADLFEVPEMEEPAS